MLADGTIVDGPQDVPFGTVVTFGEVTPPDIEGVEWGTPTITPNPITIGDGTNPTVAVANTANFALGGFSAQKAVEGAASDLVPPTSSFALEYSYTPNGTTTPVTGTLTLLADGTVVNGPQDIPFGTEVTFGELTPPDIEGVEWGTPEITPNPVTIGDGTNTLVTVTNTADLAVGGFSAAKELFGTATGLVPPGTTFTVDYSYTPNGGGATVTGTLSLPADGTVVAGPQDVPFGTVVTFTEVAPPVIPGVIWSDPVIVPETITIGDGTNPTVFVVNAANLAVGGFSVQKAITGDAAALVPPDTEFQLRYSYEFGLRALVSGTLTILADGTVVDGPQDLPFGTIVNFTELAPPDIEGVVWGTPTIAPNPVVIGEATNTLVTLTNTADLAVGGFSAAKVVTGDGAGSVPADTLFTLSYSYTVDGTNTTGTLSLRADGTVVDGPQDLPFGTIVTFSELTPPTVAGVEWGIPTLSPDRITIGDGTNLRVTVTNTATASGSEIAGTGPAAVAASLWGAAVLGAGGILLMVAGRRRRA